MDIISIVLGIIGIIISIVLGVIGIIVSLFYAYDKTRKDIEKIIARDFEGNLTKNQALSMVDIYINLFRKEMRYQLNHFFDYQLDKYKEINSKVVIQNIVYDKYKFCSIEMKNKFQLFRLKGGIKFISILDCISKEPIIKAKSEIFVALNEIYNEEGYDIEVIKSKIFRSMNDTNDIGEDLMKREIETLYNR